MEAGVSGPLFISIGDEEKLNKFLELNPYVPRDQAFVDGYDFRAYKDAGFGRFDEQDPQVAKEVKMTSPKLEGGVKGWWKYMTNVGTLSPIPREGIKFGEVPEGVLRLGGTFVVRGDDILYRWNDRLPGDHPVVEDVFEIAQGAVVGEKPGLMAALQKLVSFE